MLSRLKKYFVGLKISKKKTIFLCSMFALLVVLLTLFFVLGDSKDNKKSLDSDSPIVNRSSSQVNLQEEIDEANREIKATSNKEQKLAYHYSIVDRYRDLEQYDKAIEELEKIERLEGGSFYLYESYGDMYWLKGDETTSNSYYEKAIEEARKKGGIDVELYRSNIDAKKGIIKEENNQSGEIPG